MTTLSWDLVGGDPAPGEPEAFAGLAGDLADTAERAGDAGDQLTRFASSVDEGIWTGEAADAFGDKIAELPPKLATLARSYDTAATAMAGYGTTLGEATAAGRRCWSTPPSWPCPGRASSWGPP